VPRKGEISFELDFCIQCGMLRRMFKKGKKKGKDSAEETYSPVSVPPAPTPAPAPASAHSTPASVSETQPEAPVSSGEVSTQPAEGMDLFNGLSLKAEDGDTGTPTSFGFMQSPPPPLPLSTPDSPIEDKTSTPAPSPFSFVSSPVSQPHGPSAPPSSTSTTPSDGSASGFSFVGHDSSLTETAPHVAPATVASSRSTYQARSPLGGGKSGDSPSGTPKERRRRRGGVGIGAAGTSKTPGKHSLLDTDMTTDQEKGQVDGSLETGSKSSPEEELVKPGSSESQSDDLVEETTPVEAKEEESEQVEHHHEETPSPLKDHGGNDAVAVGMTQDDHDAESVCEPPDSDGNTRDKSPVDVIVPSVMTESSEDSHGVEVDSPMEIENEKQLDEGDGTDQDLGKRHSAPSEEGTQDSVDMYEGVVFAHVEPKKDDECKKQRDSSSSPVLMSPYVIEFQSLKETIHPLIKEKEEEKDALLSQLRKNELERQNTFLSIAQCRNRIREIQVELEEATNEEDFERAENLMNESNTLYEQVVTHLPALQKCESAVYRTESDIGGNTADSSRSIESLRYELKKVEDLREKQAKYVDQQVVDLSPEAQELQRDIEHEERGIEKEEKHIEVDLTSVQEEIQKMVDRMENETRDLFSRKSDLQGAHDSVVAEIAELEERLRKKKEEATNLMKSIQKVEGMIHNTQRRYQEGLDNEREEEAKLESGQSRCLKKKKNLEHKRRKLEIEKQKSEEHKATEQDHLDGMDDFLGMYRNLQNRWNTLSHSVSDATTVIHTGIEGVLDTEETVKMTHTKIEQLERNIHSIVQRRYALHSEVTQLRQDMSSSETRLPELARDKKLAVSARDFAEARRITGEIKNLETLRKEGEKRIEGMQSQLQELEGNANNLGKEKDVLENEYDGLLRKLVVQRLILIEKETTVLQMEDRRLALGESHCDALMNVLKQEKAMMLDSPGAEGVCLSSPPTAHLWCRLNSHPIPFPFPTLPHFFVC
jgi:hypothetical protein